MAVLYIFLLLSALFTCSLAATCYQPDGKPTDDPSVQPCNGAGADTVSMCCSLNKTTYPDQCLSNGLCSGYENVFRDYCTDETWKSPLCLNLCTTGGGMSRAAVGSQLEVYLNYTAGHAQVTECNDGSYCCGADNTTCCNLGKGEHIASILIAPSSSSLISIGTVTLASSTSNMPTSPPVSTASNTPTSSPVFTAIGTSNTATSSSSDINSSSLSKGAIIGVGVGCSITAILIGAAAIWYSFARKRASSGLAELGELDSQKRLAKYIMREMPVPSAPTELWHKEPHVELESASRVELAG